MGDIMTNLLTLQNNKTIEKASNVYNQLRRVKPATRADLKNYVKVYLGLDVPEVNICPEHNSPMDYLWHAFRGSSLDARRSNTDCIVWANRTGG
jgi:hypothetical protein